MIMYSMALYNGSIIWICYSSVDIRCRSSNGAVDLVTGLEAIEEDNKHPDFKKLASQLELNQTLYVNKTLHECH